MQGNNLITLNENFLQLPALIYFDLRDNSDLCRNCPVLSADAYNTRLNGCKVDKANGNKEINKKYEDCIRVKISEQDDIKSQLGECFSMKENLVEKTLQNFTKCSQGLGVSLTNIQRVDKCVMTRISEESRAQTVFENCVSNKLTKEPKITELLQNCYNERKAAQKKVDALFGNCSYCYKMGQYENAEKCALRFVKDYGDKIENFQANVENFFKK